MQITEAHYEFSENYPLALLSESERAFLEGLDLIKKEFNFPAIKNDIGYFLNELVRSHKLQNIYEFGSGYGHSSFWYFAQEASEYVKTVFLNEIKPDFKVVYDKIEWPREWEEKTKYFCGDAFENIESVDSIDLLLIDGVKADYLKFIEHASRKLSSNAFVAIDNAFWKGSVVFDGLTSGNSTKAMRHLHEEVRTRLSKDFFVNYFPFRDGLLLLRKKL